MMGYLNPLPPSPIKRRLWFFIPSKIGGILLLQETLPPVKVPLFPIGLESETEDPDPSSNCHLPTSPLVDIVGLGAEGGMRFSSVLRLKIVMVSLDF